MPEPEADPVLVTFVFGMMLLSIAACMRLLYMHRRGPILPYEPRRPVPWGAAGAILAAVFLLNVGLTALASVSGPVTSDTPIAPSVSRLVATIIGQTLIIFVFLFVVAIFSRATLRDLGLPTNLLVSVRDACIGAAACLAALAPVRIVQITLMYVFFPQLVQSEHPVIKMVMADPDPTFFLLTGVFTVIVAPICEEITFRLLLQGWLERWEDKRIGWRTPRVEPLPVSDEINAAANNPMHPEQLSSDAQYSPTGAAPVGESSVDEVPESTEPPRIGVFGLSHGWFPILVSSAMFGLAHYGYGPEPVPIFLLGIVLGYVYQRTHRLLPGIVTHALFNLFTMFTLWRMMYHHS